MSSVAAWSAPVRAVAGVTAAAVSAASTGPYPAAAPARTRHLRNSGLSSAGIRPYWTRPNVAVRPAITASPATTAIRGRWIRAATTVSTQPGTVASETVRPTVRRTATPTL